MKKLLSAITISFMLLLLAACDMDIPFLQELSATPAPTPEVIEVTPTPEPTPYVISPADMAGREYCFSSGAGGWSDVLTINEDGTFNGYYHDSDMGDSTEEYPNGVVYECVYSGRLTDFTRINDYTFSAKITDMAYERPVGGTVIRDGVQYRFTAPYGLNNTDTVIIYNIGTPVSLLPAEFIDWTIFAINGSTELTFIGLYNETEKQGFSSYEKVVTGQGGNVFVHTPVDFNLEGLNSILPRSDELKSIISTSPNMDQYEMNGYINELFTLWDNVLNDIWQQLNNALPEEERKTLLDDELRWIDFKDSEAEKAAGWYSGAASDGAYNMTCANMTEARVFELVERYK